MPSPDLIYLAIYVRFRHHDISLREEAPARADPQAVGPLAAQYATRYLRGEFTEEAANQVHVAHAAGLLVYAMDGYGLAYEDVCEVAGREVAEILAVITPDNRLPEPRRHIGLRSALGQADPVAKVVRLAEIVAWARGVLTGVLPDRIAAHEQLLKHRADRDVHLIRAMHALNDRLDTQVGEAMATLGRLTRMADESRRPGRKRG